MSRSHVPGGADRAVGRRSGCSPRRRGTNTRRSANLLLVAQHHHGPTLYLLKKRGFADIAEEAWARMLLKLQEEVLDPTAKIADIKAWCYAHSIGAAYDIRREARGVTIELVPLSHAEGLSARDIAHTGLASERADEPDHRLLAAVEEQAEKAWRARRSRAFKKFPPEVMEALRAEVEREARGEEADRAHRKRLERARRCAQHILRRHGINSPHPPDELRPPRRRVLRRDA